MAKTNDMPKTLAMLAPQPRRLCRGRLLPSGSRAQNRFGPMNSFQSRGDASSYSRQLAILPLTMRTMTVPCVGRV